MCSVFAADRAAALDDIAFIGSFPAHCGEPPSTQVHYTIQNTRKPNMNSTRLVAAALLAVSIAVPGWVVAKEQQVPEVTEDGLHLVKDSKLALVYAEPGASLAGYERVMLLDAYVALKKNWERDQRTSSSQAARLSSKDIENIKNNLAQEFKSVFSDVLEKGGYPVVDEAADDVLLIRPAIINLDINAPETPQAGRSQTYTRSAGEMTLYVEAFDSVTGDLLAKAVDRQVDGSNAGFYTWANSVSNRAAADRIITGWATILLKALDEAKQHTSATDTAAVNES
jgi:hypothetical protein